MKVSTENDNNFGYEKITNIQEEGKGWLTGDHDVICCFIGLAQYKYSTTCWSSTKIYKEDAIKIVPLRSDLLSP
jgi:hypothetical protein